MSDHPDASRLAAFDAGALPPAEWADVERHVATCADCCRTLDGLPDDAFVSRVRALAGDALADLPPELADHPRYRVLEVLGAGGMGVVYRATHLLMQRTVALKVIHRRLSDRPAFVEHFRREVRAVARLSHPNIVTAHDADQAGDVHFLVMEHVEGVALDRLVARDGPLPVALACDVVRQAALGLHHAHERGLVHRDVKPGNLMLTKAGTVKVLDFGLAQLAAETPADAPEGSAPLVGTPDYVAPEQARDPAGADARADVYGLGGTLYFLLTGQPPFPGGTVLQKLLAHQDCPPTPVTDLRPAVSPALAALLERMLAKDPARRPSTAAAVADALARLAPAPAAPVPPARRRALRTLLLLSPLPIGLVAALALALYFHRPEPAPLTTMTAPVGSQPTPREPPPSTEPAPTTPPGLAVMSPEQLAREKTEMRNRAADWLRANIQGGPRTPPVTDTIATIDRNMDRSDVFRVLIGPGFLKSGNPALLFGRSGLFDAFELTGDAARTFPVKGKAIRIMSFLTSPDLRRVAPRVLLSDAVIEGGRVVPGRPVVGTVRYRVLDRWDGDSSLRLTFYLSKRRVNLLIPRFHLPAADQGTIPFAFGPYSNESELTPGPYVLFVEITTRDDEGKIYVESSAASALVQIVTPDPKKLGSQSGSGRAAPP